MLSSQQSAWTGQCAQCSTNVGAARYNSKNTCRVPNVQICYLHNVSKDFYNNYIRDLRLA